VHPNREQPEGGVSALDKFKLGMMITTALIVLACCIRVATALV